MRRADREITNPVKIHQIIDSAHCCRLGFSDNGSVYMVPLSYGWEEQDGKPIFYFHSAREGRKIDLVGTGTRVGFELDTGFRLDSAPKACEFSAAFLSVIGTGWVSPITDPAQKLHALGRLMAHYAGTDAWVFSQAMLDRITVLKLEVEELSCKEHL